jgi:hypothetical protein
MSGTPTTSKISIVAVGEPTLFGSLARLVPKDIAGNAIARRSQSPAESISDRTAFYR